MPLIVDGNKEIKTPIKDLLEMLRQQLYVSHIDKLNSVEYTQNNARVTCPIHSDGHEKTPSCDILLEDRVKCGVLIPAGTVFCFGCHYKAGFVRFVADCLNISYRDATEWILNISTYDYVEEERKIADIDNVEKEVNNYNTLPIVTLDELKSYDYIHPYMFKRRLTDEIINKFDVGYDPKTQALTFPVWVDGKCLFVARRKVNYKRFDMPEIYPKPIYGLDYLTTNEVIVCESVLNALTCYVYGKEAVALFGTGSDYQISLLNKLQQREIILALDNDNAGRAGTKRLIKQLHGKIITYMKVPEGKDINDLEQHEFEKIYSEREIV